MTGRGAPWLLLGLGLGLVIGASTTTPTPAAYAGLARITRRVSDVLAVATLRLELAHRDTFTTDREASR